ncbi:unnamed protein product [Oikopleura dioica]|uniref:Uncharacterized protein n=1 Tax=Oikopleura dioica TaxID=34765 RepID=E4Y8Z2_OIKDI|nr:unnamed protein product [Oikopleura dioica]
MDHRKSFLLNLSRALSILESENLVAVGSWEKVRTDREYRHFLKKPNCSLRNTLCEALQDPTRRAIFFETGGYEFRENEREDVRASRLKVKIHQMFADPLKNKAYSFAGFFQKIRRPSFQNAQLSVSQTRICSDDEDMEEIASPPPKRRLRSSEAPEDVPSTSATAASALLESSAADLWKTTKIPFDSVNKDEHDMRGYSTMRGNMMAHKLVLGLLARGMKATQIHAAYERMCEIGVSDFKGATVMSPRSIDEKRFCLDTMNRIHLTDKIEKSGKGVIVVDDATMLRGNSSSGIVFICSDGSSVLLALTPNLAKTSEALAEQTMTTLKNLPFWSSLKSKIAFIMSDSARKQTKANQLMCEMFKKMEIEVHELNCLMHACAIQEKNTYDQWTEKKGASEYLLLARKLHMCIMKSLGDGPESLQVARGHSIRPELDQVMLDWYGLKTKLFFQGQAMH